MIVEEEDELEEGELELELCQMVLCEDEKLLLEKSKSEVEVEELIEYPLGQERK